MNSKYLFCFALVLSLGLYGCSTTPMPPPNHGRLDAGALGGQDWGESVGGFQLAAAVDETNSIVHCWIRNATTNEMDYPSFDFGYFEMAHLEVRSATNWVEVRAALFPKGNAYSSACPYLVGRVRPGEIVSCSNNPYPPQSLETMRRKLTNDMAETFLRFEHGDTNRALLDERSWHEQQARTALMFKECSRDTFAVDLLFWRASPEVLTNQTYLEARVCQSFRARGFAEMPRLYSAVFPIKEDLVRPYMKQVGK